MGLDALIEQLKTVPDWRRGGKKVDYPLWIMLLMSLLGVMSGYTSLRGLADFMKRHQSEVVELFGLENPELPKYSTIRRMAHYVCGSKVAEIFQRWAEQACPVESGEAIAMDGKALASTGQHWSESEQDFVSVVSACVHSQGWVIAQTSFHNGKSSEITSVRDLLKTLDVTGVWFTMDALHAQKKQSVRLPKAAMNTALA